MNLQDDTPRSADGDIRSRSDTTDGVDRLQRESGRPLVDAAVEAVTFGRRPLLLFRIWVIQVVLLLADVGVFRSIYPLLRDIFRSDILLEACLVLTVAFLALLWTYLGKMGRLSFAPRFHRARYRCWSVLGYLVLGGVVVAGAFYVLDMTPGATGQHLGLDLALGGMLTASLAALIAIGFYAQFGAGAFPRRRHTQRVIDEWLASLDWPETDECTAEKDRRYAEFEHRTTQVADLLDTALTTDGRILRDEFHAWHDSFTRYSILTQERIVSGDARNPELAASHDRLQELRERLAVVGDVHDPETTEMRERGARESRPRTADQHAINS